MKFGQNRKRRPRGQEKQTELNCQCGHRTKFRFRKASVFECAMVMVTCAFCETLWSLKLKKTTGKDNYDTAIKCVTMSQKLAEIMKAKAEKKSVGQSVLEKFKKETQDGPQDHSENQG